MEKLSCFILLKLSRSLCRRRGAGTSLLFQGPWAPAWLPQKDRGAAVGQGSKKLEPRALCRQFYPQTTTDQQSCALSRLTALAQPLQRTVRLLFRVKAPIFHHIYLDSPTQAAEPACEEGPQGEPPRPSWCAGAGRGARDHVGSLLICHLRSYSQHQPQIQTGPDLGEAQKEDKADMKNMNLAGPGDPLPAIPSL